MGLMEIELARLDYRERADEAARANAEHRRRAEYRRRAERRRRAEHRAGTERRSGSGTLTSQASDTRGGESPAGTVRRPAGESELTSESTPGLLPVPARREAKIDSPVLSIRLGGFRYRLWFTRSVAV